MFQLGVKIQNGKYVCGRDNGEHEWVKGMSFIAGGYLTEEEIQDRRESPPCHDMWGERPLEVRQPTPTPALITPTLVIRTLT